MNKIELKNWLKKRQKSIVEKWAFSIMPGHTSESIFENLKTDRFSNPMYYTIHSELDKLYEKLLDFAEEPHNFKTDQLMKIQALYNSDIKKALSFTSILKNILEQNMIEDGVEISHLSLLDLQLELMMKMASVQFVENRKQLQSIKNKELESGVFNDLPSDATCPSAFLHSAGDRTNI